MKARTALIVFILTALFSAIALTTSQHAEAASRRGTDVQIYSLQTLINQAYQMALEGASLIMLDQMGKGGVFEEIIIKRGWSMIDLGKRIITDAVNGEEIKQLISEGKGSDPLITNVRENGAQILEAVDGIRTYLKTNSTQPQLSQMHSLFTLLNHGMKMATDGANMIMLGRTGEPGGAKDTLQKHGRAMMRDGRVLIIRLSDNDTMKDLHKAGYTIQQDPAMAALHNSIAQALRIIDRLARM